MTCDAALGKVFPVISVMWWSAHRLIACIALSWKIYTFQVTLCDAMSWHPISVDIQPHHQLSCVRCTFQNMEEKIIVAVCDFLELYHTTSYFYCDRQKSCWVSHPNWTSTTGKVQPQLLTQPRLTRERAGAEENTIGWVASLCDWSNDQNVIKQRDTQVTGNYVASIAFDVDTRLVYSWSLDIALASCLSLSLVELKFLCLLLNENTNKEWFF